VIKLEIVLEGRADPKNLGASEEEQERRIVA